MLFFSRSQSSYNFVENQMAVFLLPVLVFAMVGSSDAAWCVCKQDQATTSQQKALDYACGAGADCNPILQNGACYNPNTVNGHCSYAVNSYYQRKGQAQGSCDFAGAAGLVSSDPSPGGACTYPATPSAAGTSNTPSTNTPGSSTSPGTFTPNTGSTGTAPHWSDWRRTRPLRQQL
ncbi:PLASMODESMATA CALLOSE-BINDING PROTEIN 3-like [Dioscorea cayenensis subsp. rotundata]|uniref:PLASMODESMATA CALLOSE-BINDING PROTEIN 3-like n=1 Tax=Dioscorea cayennensis subsp. rotundata TaxID=55577 RepID=A0AB40CD31_DIOCR|nr:PLASMODESMATA CALLOSE-BINDING PROTEIN 3-like [Dioscorea cayenensis subsp. rotundata]